VKRRLCAALSISIAALWCAQAWADSINWTYSYEDALKLAAREGKPIMVGFYTTWCMYCRKLDQETYVDPAVVAASKNYVCLKVDGEKRRDVAYGYGIGKFPTILFLDQSGRVIWREFGFRPPDFLAARMNEVLAYYKKATAADPYLKSAFEKAQARGFDEAIAILDKGISLHGDDARLFAARALMKRYKSDIDGAMADMDRAVSINPKADELYTLRGMAYYEKRDLDRASADFDKAISLNPWNFEAYNARGVIGMDRGDPDTAIKNFNTAIVINPRHANIYFNRGAAYAMKASPDKAIADFTTAIKLDPRQVNAYSNRAAIYLAAKQYDKAWADVRAVESLGFSMKPEFIDQLRRASGRDR
jgi:tetratricopeptide (TPR) repeat protein